MEGKMKYRVALQESEEGFCVWVPGLPGCVSEGATEEEALANIQEYMEVALSNAAGMVIREVEVTA